MILRLADVAKTFAGVRALTGVSFEVADREIRAVIGPNGAGKTTLFNVITGLFPPDAGVIEFRGQDVTGLAPERMARLGVARTFQRAQLFRSLTVWENAMLGRHLRSRAELFACGFRLRRAAREEAAIRERALACLEFVGLADRRHRLARELPLGAQRYVELARALATEPALVLLDEPTAGLNDAETDHFRDLVFRVRDLGVTVLVIEHHMKFVMDVSDAVVVLSFGAKIAEGPPAAIQREPAVIEAYLGTDDDLD